jgi:4'-phosphopantetheinyl transferase
MHQLKLPESACSAGLEVWELALDLAKPLCDSDWTLLSREEAARARRYRWHEDRVRAVTTRAALRRLLGSRLRRPPQSLLFVYGPHGKPSLPQAPHIQFNVSHAGSYALIAVSNEGEIGVDIERCESALDLDALRVHVSSYVERTAGDNVSGFFELWVVKEAVLKALGLGIAEHLQDVSVLGRETERGACGHRFYRVQVDCAHWHRFRVWPLDVPVGYVAAVAHVEPRTLLYVSANRELSHL